MTSFYRAGSAIVFNIESLVDFILATGDFSDPETRLPFSDQDLTEIDALVGLKEIKKTISIINKISKKITNTNCLLYFLI